MFCGQCGEQIKDDSKFCRHCGAKQMEQAEQVATIAPVALATSPIAPSTERQKPPRTALVVGIPLAFVFSLVLIAIGSAPKSGVSDNGASEIESQAAALDAETNVALGVVGNSTASTTEATAGNWSYSSDEDKIRGRSTYFARTTSTNTAHQDPPYDAETTMEIVVRESPSSGTNVMFIISSGQMMCPSYEGCSATVRFDNGPAQRVSLTGPADNSSETVFVEGAKGFLAKLKKAKHVVVEKTLYQAGNPQFEFNVDGLKWAH